MFNFAVGNGKIDYTLWHEDKPEPYVPGYYRLLISQESNDTPSHQYSVVCLFVDENPDRALGNITYIDPNQHLQSNDYPLSQKDQQTIARACKEMIACVATGISTMTEAKQKELDAVIQPYLNQLHQKFP